MVELPTGTVTFLYTDIEGSTRPPVEQPGHRLQRLLWPSVSWLVDHLTGADALSMQMVKVAPDWGRGTWHP